MLKCLPLVIFSGPNTVEVLWLHGNKLYLNVQMNTDVQPLVLHLIHEKKIRNSSQKWKLFTAKIKAVGEHNTESESAVCNTGIKEYEWNWLKKNLKIHGALVCGPQDSKGFFHGSSHYSFYCFINKMGNTYIHKQKGKKSWYYWQKNYFLKKAILSKTCFSKYFWLVCALWKTHFVDSKIRTNWLC